MGTSDKYQPTEAELEILQVLWAKGEATVREVHEALSASRKVGYTTILKQMQRMTDKDMILRSGHGKSHQYKAAIPETKVQKSMFNRLLDTAFKGSAIDLAMHALGQGKTSPEELQELMAWLEQQQKGDAS